MGFSGSLLVGLFDRGAVVVQDLFFSMDPLFFSSYLSSQFVLLLSLR